MLFDVDKAHIQAIASDGLTIEAPDGILHVRLAATCDVAAIGRADLAIILVDSNATGAAAEIAAGILGPEGFVLTLQNGIGNVEALAAVLGAGRVVAGTTYNSAAKLGPGRVLHSNIGETTIGEIDGGPSARVEDIAQLLRRAGLPITVSDNVMGHIWMKFVLNAAINPVSAMTGLRPGEIARISGGARTARARARRNSRRHCRQRRRSAGRRSARPCARSCLGAL